MLDVLRFIFSSFWVFAGTWLLLFGTLAGIVGMIEALRRK